MPKTERLAIKMLAADKKALERMAQAEGEPVAVVVRKIIRRAVREFEANAGGAGEPPDLRDASASHAAQPA